MKIDGIIFTGMEKTTTLSRPAGAVRMRTFLEQHNYNIEVVDFFSYFTDEEIQIICDRFITDETIFVGISITFLYDHNKINNLFKYVKEKYPKVKTLIGGSEGSVENLDSTLIDNFIWGYSEEAFLHYLKYLKRKRLDNLQWLPYENSLAINAESFYKNDDTNLTLNWLPSDLIKGNFLPIEISRGCIFKCRFCQFPLLGKKKNDYIRHVDNLTEEIRRNYEMFGVNNYWFNDDTFNDNVVKLEYVAEAIAKSGVDITYSAFLRADLLARFPETISMLADTGLVAANFGIETLHPVAKKAIGKGQENERQFDAIRQLKKYKPIWTHTGMIVGLPGEPLSSIFKSQEWFIKQDFEVFNSWNWYSLTIRKNVMTRLSEFESDYEKWGYSEMSLEELKDNFYDEDTLFTHSGINKTFYWKNKYMNWFQANIIAEKLTKETELHKTKKGLRYTDKPNISGIGNNNINHEGQPVQTYELIGYGFSMQDIIDGKIDNNVLIEKTKESQNNIQEYKKLKLGL